VETGAEQIGLQGSAVSVGTGSRAGPRARSSSEPLVTANRGGALPNPEANADVVAAVAALEFAVVRVQLADLPFLIGEVERVKAVAWRRMTTDPVAPAPDPPRRLDEADVYLTIPEVAQRLRFSVPYIYELVRRGDFSVIRRGKRGIRLRLSDLRAWETRHAGNPLDGGPDTLLRSGHGQRRVPTLSRAAHADTGRGRDTTLDHRASPGPRRLPRPQSRRDTAPRPGDDGPDGST
jgi:excisionase family DNA binding protein